jgi:hypothetical protein
VSKQITLYANKDKEEYRSIVERGSEMGGIKHVMKNL